MTIREFREALSNGTLGLVQEGVRQFGVDADLTQYVVGSMGSFTANLLGKMISLTPYPEDFYCWEYTPLHWAISGNQRHIVEHLIKEGAQINAQNKVGNTPLHLAIYLGYIDIALFLLGKGADPTIPNKKETHYGKLLSPEEGCTALHYAVQWGNFELVSQILSYRQGHFNAELFNQKAKIDKSGKYVVGFPETPLQLVLCRRLEPHRDDKGGSIGVELTYEEKLKLVRLFLEPSAIPTLDDSEAEDHFLHLAIKQESMDCRNLHSNQNAFEIITLLLSALNEEERTVALNQRNKDGLTPLELAMSLNIANDERPDYFDKQKLIYTLLIYKADPLTKAPYSNDTALHLVIKELQESALLLEDRKNLLEPENIIQPESTKADHLFNPLLDILEFFYHQQVDIIQELLNTQNGDALTPLGLCYLNDGSVFLNSAIAFLLLPLGASLEKENKSLKRAFGYLEESARRYFFPNHFHQSSHSDQNHVVNTHTYQEPYEPWSASLLNQASPHPAYIDIPQTSQKTPLLKGEVDPAPGILPPAITIFPPPLEHNTQVVSQSFYQLK